MPVEPQRIGRYLTNDHRGCVVPDVGHDKIAEPWQSLVAYVAQALLGSGKVSAVYVRGSVPRGLAIDHVSDVDFVYLAESELDELEKQIDLVCRERFPFARGVELIRLGEEKFNRVHAPHTRPYFHMLLKTQSLCVGGTNVTQSIASFRPDGNMVCHAFLLQEEFAQLAGMIAEEPEKKAETIKWYGRRLVRAGHEITLATVPRYTRDLYLCYEQFAQIYPQHADMMFGALRNSLNGNLDWDEFLPLIEFVQSQCDQLYGR